MSGKALAIFNTIIKTGCKNSKVLEEKQGISLSYWVKGQGLPGPWPCSDNVKRCPAAKCDLIILISVGGRERAESVHLGKFSEGIIRHSGNFSDCSPALFDISGRNFTAFLNLASSYAHNYTFFFYKQIIILPEPQFS